MLALLAVLSITIRPAGAGITSAVPAPLPWLRVAHPAGQRAQIVDLGTGEAIGAPAFNRMSCWRVEKRDGKVFVREKIEPADPHKPVEARSRSGKERVVIVGGGVIGLAVARGLTLTIAVDADLNSAQVGGRDEQEIAGGVETWWFGRRIGVRGGGGTNTAAGGGSFGAFGVTIVPYPGVNLDGAVTRGSDSARDQWSIGVRLAY